jgi:hypothetical protein
MPILPPKSRTGSTEPSPSSCASVCALLFIGRYHKMLVNQLDSRGISDPNYQSTTSKRTSFRILVDFVSVERKAVNCTSAYSWVEDQSNFYRSLNARSYSIEFFSECLVLRCWQGCHKRREGSKNSWIFGRLIWMNISTTRHGNNQSLRTCNGLCNILNQNQNTVIKHLHGGTLSL